ncbi:MAG TPA: PAS domain-containing protein [Actinomycetes bacterium]|nr:PAS domain-containing protein [Actinomycetes bacterium]
MTAARRVPSSTRDVVLDALLNQLPVVVFAAGTDGVCTYSEGGGLPSIGLTAGQMVGVDLFEAYAHRPQGVARLKAALAGQDVSYAWRLNDRTFETRLQPLHGPDGSVDGLIGISLDITEKTLAQEDLELYRAFVDAAPQFVALANIDGSVRYVNPGGRRLAGIPDEVDVTRTSIADYLTEEGLKLSLEVEQPSVIEHGSYNGETTLKHWPTGEGIPVHVSSFLVRDPATGEPRAMATVQTDITAQKEAQQESERRLSQQRGLFLHLHEAQETERRRIAGEVHDDTIQSVAAVNIRLQSALRQLERQGHEQAVALLAGVGETVRHATQRLRRLLYDLDVPDRLDQDLVSGLRDHVDLVCREEGLRGEVVGSLTEVPPLHVSRVLFRIAQEALANVRAHADAGRVVVEVGERDGGYTLSVRDDGVGLPAEAAAPARRRPAGEGHLGLRSMGERAESVGGWCSVRGLDGPGGGTIVEAWVPAGLDYTARAARGSTAYSTSARALLEQTLESISEGFAALDRDWRYVYVNQVGADMIRRHDLPGKVCWEEFEFSPLVEQAYRDAMRLQQPTVASVLYPDLGRWVESRVFPSQDGLAVFFRDVTSERELERRADARERVLGRAAQLARLLAAEPDLETALRAAADLVLDTFRLSAVRISTTTSEMSVGEPADDDTESTVPLVLLGERVGELTVHGSRVPLEALPGIADGLALRLGAHRERSGEVVRSEDHG